MCITIEYTNPYHKLACSAASFAICRRDDGNERIAADAARRHELLEEPRAITHNLDAVHVVSARRGEVALDQARAFQHSSFDPSRQRFLIKEPVRKADDAFASVGLENAPHFGQHSFGILDVLDAHRTQHCIVFRAVQSHQGRIVIEISHHGLALRDAAPRIGSQFFQVHAMDVDAAVFQRGGQMGDVRGAQIQDRAILHEVILVGGLQFLHEGRVDVNYEFGLRVEHGVWARVDLGAVQRLDETDGSPADRDIARGCR
mmetsp:Transcript_23415/g.65340  ORF Transcript_23415/g.65340 Transcript_23415/m.65340 type:complete len:259 (-) Transcript_23415:614-1390(-)